jgi:hypothetical protein
MTIKNNFLSFPYKNQNRQEQVEAKTIYMDEENENNHQHTNYG